jgi:hypothetical protein
MLCVQDGSDTALLGEGWQGNDQIADFCAPNVPKPDGPVGAADKYAQLLVDRMDRPARQKQGAVKIDAEYVLIQEGRATIPDVCAKGSSRRA